MPRNHLPISLMLATSLISSAALARDCLLPPLKSAMIIPFDADRSALSPQVLSTVQHLAGCARAHPDYDLLLTGFTTDPGSAAQRQVEAMRYAQTVQRALQDAQVAPERITTRSIGNDAGELGKRMNTIPQGRGVLTHWLHRPAADGAK